MPAHLHHLGKISLWSETFGNPNDPAILLIRGMGSQGIMWYTPFCKHLADLGFFVIRYDHRDTGQSTCLDFSEHPYNLSDMAQDALDLLDAYRIEKAHLVGLSMGGYIAQFVAISDPERLLSLTSIASTVDNTVIIKALAGQDYREEDLPPPTREVMDLFGQPSTGKKSREAHIAHNLQTWRVLNGSKAGFDEKFWRRLSEKAYDRAHDITASNNHGRAIRASLSNRRPLLESLAVPALIIHGGQDPLIPPTHAHMSLKAIPEADLLMLPDMGHMLAPQFEPALLAKMADFYPSYS